MAERVKAEGGRIVAIWDGVSTGTANMISIARELEVPLHLYRIERRNLRHLGKARRR